MNEQQKLTFFDVFFPFLVIAIMVMVKLFEWQQNVSFSDFGIYPRTLSGLKGIVFSPFLHGDWEHLVNNMVPMFLLGLAIFYFYKPVALKIYLYSLFITGLWVWAAARPSYHIGASGMVYAFASFVFFSGFIRRYYRLIALSLTVVFIYGSMIWGIFPIKHGISWESHLFGGIAGFILAIHFRKFGPQRKIYDWQNEPDDNIDDELDDYLEEDTDLEDFNPKNISENQIKNTDKNQNLSNQPSLKIVYRYKPKD